MASDNLAIATNTVSGNIHSATSNFSLAVTSAYSMFKQKTTEIQVKLLNNLNYKYTLMYLLYLNINCLGNWRKCKRTNKEIYHVSSSIR